ncbi:MAG: class I SAM-dependent methyltransferase, partial [Proteobacteria bacterium]|nr:class I SAM-dependent methyltransferase [Pseudomonadota bacterium]
DMLGPVAGLRVLHLQCHFGMDTLTLAQQGASVTGVDFSAPAVDAARRLAQEVGLADRARFVLSDVYEAPAALRGERFDRVFASWGALCWLPDIRAWAQVVAQFLQPGGWLALADAHPTAYVFDSRTATADGRPGWWVPYLGREAAIEESAEDYADPAATLRNTRTHQWLHPLGDIVTALLEAGLTLARLQEHDAVPWLLFNCLQRSADTLYRWPDQPWLPLSFSLRAVKPGA